MDDCFEDIDFSFMVPNEIDTGTVRKHKKKHADSDSDRARDKTDNHSDADNDQQRNNGSLASRYKQSREQEDNAGLKSSSGGVEPNINLSRDELLKLLSVFEGELQARDEVIAILKTECAQNPETRYGLTTQPMRALQRDAATLDVTSQDEVCEQTKEQLKKIIQHQKESYKRLKQLLLSSQDKYQRMSLDMEEEKRKHQEYMLKSDDFVNLLEHDRERLKQILEQEKGVHERKEKELIRKIKDNKDELSRLKSLSLELVEERQEQLQALNEQKQLVATLQRQAQELEDKVKDTEKLAATEKEHATQLENELEEQSNKFYRENEELTAKLVAEENKKQQLEEKIITLTKQMKKLKCVDKNLRKTDDQLWRIKEKLEQDDRQEDLLEEVELLRNTVSDMQEAEKIYVQAQDECRELRVALESELTHTKALGGEVERLRKNARNQTEMERCVEEANFRLDEMQQLLGAECRKADKMKAQLEEFQARFAKMDETDETLKLSESKVKQLQQHISDLTSDRDGLETKLGVEKDKCAQCLEMLEDERDTITKVSQKMIEESKKVLKLKEQLATLDTKKSEEVEKLRQRMEALEKLHSECLPKERKAQIDALNVNLKKQVAMLKTRLDRLEDDNDLKEKELKLARHNHDKANANLQISTEKLKKLVSLGLNEQVAIAKYEEFKEKTSTLEIANDKLKKEVALLEERLQGQTLPKSTNTNNNNIILKGVAMSNIATQTITDNGSPTPTSPRVVATHRTTTSRGGASESTTTRSSSVRRVSSSGIRRETSTDARTTRNHSATTTTAALRRREGSSSSTSQQQASTHSKANGTILVHLKGNDEQGAGPGRQSPVSMTISHDPSAGGATPTFRIVRDAKTGSSQIETSVSESKKGINIKMTGGRPKDTSSSTKPPTSTGSKTASKSISGQKVTSRVTVHPTPSSKARSTGKIASQVSRRPSISPTRIPKLRGNTQSPLPPSSTASPNLTTRLSRSTTKTPNPR